MYKGYFILEITFFVFRTNSIKPTNNFNIAPNI